MADNSDSISTLEKIDFGTLLGAPLTACVEAQAQAAQATSQYIRQMGFDTNTDYDLEAKNLHFYFTIDGKKKRLTVPLISVVPLPYLQIDNVHLTFTADVALENGYLKGTVSKNSLSEVTENSSSDYNSDLRISVDIKATTSDMPYGISRILEVMNNAMDVKTEQN